jgi:hypothetical protein
VQIDNQDEFWDTSVKRSLELERQIRKERYARDWRRNLVVLFFVLLFTVGGLALTSLH